MTRPPRPHAYAGDGLDTGTGKDRCTVCLMPQVNARHRVPEPAPGVAEYEARKLGERDLPANVVPIRGRTDGRRRAGGAG